MAERIFVEHADGGKDRILLETENADGETEYQSFNIPQAKQLVIDLNKLIVGETPDDEACVEGVED